MAAMIARTCFALLLVPLILGAPGIAWAADNAFCVTNGDLRHGHRILWMHDDYDYEIHSALAGPEERVCFESEFLTGQGWYAKAVVKLYEDKAQTAGQEYVTPPADLGSADASARVEYCFRFDENRFVYLFAPGPCS